MSKTKNFANPVDLVHHLFNQGHDKDYIATKLFESGVAFSAIPKVFKDSKVKFRKSGLSSWKMKSVQLFVDNPEASPQDMADAIEGSVKDPMYYVKAYYDMLQFMAMKLSTK